MRILMLVISVTILLSCFSARDKQVDNEFKKYLKSLEALDIPITFDSKRGIKVRSKDYDTTLFKKFKHKWAFGPHGKAFENDSIILIIDITAGDVLVPLIMTFDQFGNKLDSLNPYTNGGVDMGYESYEYVAINGNKDILITDSTRRWDLNKEGDNIIEGTDKLTVGTMIYKIDKKGKFKKIKGQ
jgi:hypothetical protein